MTLEELALLLRTKTAEYNSNKCPHCFSEVHKPAKKVGNHYEFIWCPVCMGQIWLE